jgi:hypothetical protein
MSDGGGLFKIQKNEVPLDVIIIKRFSGEYSQEK